MGTPTFGLICQDIFGLIPQNPCMSLPDEEIGVIECPWLGLMPKSIRKYVIGTICQLTKDFVYQDISTDWIAFRIDSWEELKELNLDKMIGYFG